MKRIRLAEHQILAQASLIIYKDFVGNEEYNTAIVNFLINKK